MTWQGWSLQPLLLEHPHALQVAAAVALQVAAAVALQAAAPVALAMPAALVMPASEALLVPAALALQVEHPDAMIDVSNALPRELKCTIQDKLEIFKTQQKQNCLKISNWLRLLMQSDLQSRRACDTKLLLVAGDTTAGTGADRRRGRGLHI